MARFGTSPSMSMKWELTFQNFYLCKWSLIYHIWGLKLQFQDICSSIWLWMDTATTERCIQPPITGSCPVSRTLLHWKQLFHPHVWRLVLHQMDLLTTPHVGCKPCPVTEQTKTSGVVLSNIERLLILVQIPTTVKMLLYRREWTKGDKE